MGRRQFIDADSLQFVESQNSRIPTRSLHFRYDTFDEIDFIFVRSGIVTELPEGTALQFVLKAAGKFDSNVLAGIPFNGFSKVGSGTSTVYRGYVDTTSEVLKTALGINTTDADDVPELECHAEMLIVTAGRKQRTRLIPAVISNSLIRDEEEVPTQIPNGVILTQADIGQTVAGLVGGKVPVANLPDLTITAVTVVEDSAERLALTGISSGYSVLQLDAPSSLFIYVSGDPALEASWHEVGVTSILRAQIADFAHAATHKAGGNDAIKLDELAEPTDNETLNATAARHGLLPKLSGSISHFLNGIGQWVEISGLGGGFPLWSNIQSRPQTIQDVASITGANDDVIQKKAGSWVSRTIAQLKADLGISGDLATQAELDAAAAAVVQRANHTGTQTASTISDFASAAQAANASALSLKADLDQSGKVPATQLPSYVDDVLEYADLASLPAVGETGKIYVAVDTGKAYRWGGTAYIEIVPSPGSTDALAEGTANLYFTPRRAESAAANVAMMPADYVGPNATGTVKAAESAYSASIAELANEATHADNANSAGYADRANTASLADEAGEVQWIGVLNAPIGNGSNSNDVLRWNAATQKWEVSGSVKILSTTEQDANGLNVLKLYSQNGTLKGYLGYRQNDLGGLEAGGPGAWMQLGSGIAKINTSGAEPCTVEFRDGKGLGINGCLATKYVAKTADYTANSLASTIDCTGTLTVTLPTAVGNDGRIYTIKNSGTGIVTLATTSSQTIDGSLTRTLPSKWDQLTVQSTGANWIVIASALGSAWNEQTGTTYTLGLSDANKTVRITNAGAIDLTIPTNATVAFPVGTVLEICQGGAGKITVGGSGVTIECAATNKRTSAQHAGATLKKRDTDTWWLEGRLE